ncbi:MAG: hypothetical protein KGM24_11150, partial [Elusimicrobia bacterium]|nr:hypothetical protein [Elusimicrobiota bacterium]
AVVWDVALRPERRDVEQRVLAALPAGVRVETLGEAARWWALRARTSFWTEPRRGGLLLHVELPAEADGALLSFETARPVRACRALTRGVSAVCAGRTIALSRTGGARSVELRLELVKGDASEAGRVPGP